MYGNIAWAASPMRMALPFVQVVKGSMSRSCQRPRSSVCLKTSFIHSGKSLNVSSIRLRSPVETQDCLLSASSFMRASGTRPTMLHTLPSRAGPMIKRQSCAIIMDVKGCLGSIFLQNSGVSRSSFSVGMVRRYAERPVGLGVISPTSDLRIVL